jgi:hypothetical protein
MLAYHPGPPFPVGDVILVDVGEHDLQQAFVMELDHPQYQLRLENRVTVCTSIQESWLKARMLRMAPDQDDLFVRICKEVERGPLKMGSYGVHGNAQQESLCLVEEAKAVALVVKADDVEVPTHLWNDQVYTAEVLKERRTGL